MQRSKHANIALRTEQVLALSTAETLLLAASFAFSAFSMITCVIGFRSMSALCDWVIQTGSFVSPAPFGYAMAWMWCATNSVLVAYVASKRPALSAECNELLFEIRTPLALTYLLLGLTLICWRFNVSFLSNLAFALGLLLTVAIYIRSRFVRDVSRRDGWCILVPLSVHCGWFVCLWLIYIGTVFVHSALSINFALWLIVFFTVCVAIKHLHDWIFTTVIYWVIVAIGTQHRALWVIILGISVPLPFLAAEAFFQANLYAYLVEKWQQRSRTKRTGKTTMPREKKAKNVSIDAMDDEHDWEEDEQQNDHDHDHDLDAWPHDKREQQELDDDADSEKAAAV